MNPQFLINSKFLLCKDTYSERAIMPEVTCTISYEYCCFVCASEYVFSQWVIETNDKLVALFQYTIYMVLNNALVICQKEKNGIL